MSLSTRYTHTLTHKMRPSIIVQPLASCSRRTYASSPSTNPHLASPSDTRTETIRRVLYPPDAHSPNSASPTGSYHPEHIKRLQHLIPNPEVYETIERAWKLAQREKRDERAKSLGIKLKAMKDACEELDRLTGGAAAAANAESGAGSGGGGTSAGPGKGGLSRTVYDRAMSRPTLRGEKVEIPTGSSGGKKETPESRWAAARIEGLVPREMWVPTETRGKGWNYDWTRPGK